MQSRNEYLKVLRERKKRKETYDGQVKAALAKVWEIFDYSCGQRLKPLLEAEVDRLRELKEIEISEETALKLKKMSSATIDRKLKHRGSFCIFPGQRVALSLAIF